MEMIDKDRLFSLFGGDEASAKEILDKPDTFLDTATAKLGMFTKLIYNHEVFHNKLKKFMKQVKEDYDDEATKQASAFTVYNRAWYYIKEIDLKDVNHFSAVVEYKYKPLYDSLSKAITYFEELEEYKEAEKLLKERLKEKLKITRLLKILFVDL